MTTFEYSTKALIATMGAFLVPSLPSSRLAGDGTDCMDSSNTQ
jgi:hypothetical protein